MVQCGAGRWEGQYKLDWRNQGALRLFRQEFESTFSGLEDNIKDYIKNTFKNLLDQTQKELSNAPNTDKFRIVKKLISGDSKIATISQSKALMFHETIIYGLSMLKAISDLITGFKTYVTATSNFAFDNASFKKLIQVIYGLTEDSQKLVTVTYGNYNNFVQFDFNALKIVTEKLISDIRKWINHFILYVTDDIIDVYEGRSYGGTINTLSLHSLEQNLTDSFRTPDSLSEFEQSEEDKLIDKTLYKHNTTLNDKDHIQKILSDGTKWITGQAIEDLIIYPNGTSITTTNQTYIKATEAFPTVTEYKSIVITASGVDTTKQTEPLFGSTTPGIAPVPIVKATITNFTYTDGIPRNLSLFFLFNKCISDFLRIFYDIPLKKIYLNLLQPFISGPLSSAVNGAKDTQSTAVFPIGD